MEQQQRSLAFTAAVGLIILAIIVGSIYYLVKFIQSRVASSRQTPQASIQALVQSSGNIEGESTQEPKASSISIINLPKTGASPVPSSKIYNPGNFQFSYPKNWGLLTCSNSAHFELDPLNSADSKIECTSSIKPITVLVDDIEGCEGEVKKISELEVINSKKVDGGYTVYRWCTKTNPVLNITHRVSKGGEKAVSIIDYSTQIEETITNLTFSRGS